MRNKVTVVLGLIFILLITTLTGCTNPFKNMKLVLSETNIEIVIDENIEDLTKTVVASITGVSKNVSKEILATTQNTCVSVNTSVNEEGQTLINITPVSTATESTAIISVVTKEGNKSANINVTLIKKPTEMSINQDYKPAITVNSSLQLNSSLAVNYGDNHAEVTEKQVEFSLVNQYEDISITKSGLLTMKSTKPALNQDGVCEILVEAKNIATDLTATFGVRVIEAITSQDQVSLSLNGEPTNNNLVIKLNQDAEPVLEVSSSIAGEEYVFNVESQDSSIVRDTALSDTTFALTGLIAKSTTLSITCAVKGYEQYSPFTFSVPVSNIFVPTDISLNGSLTKRTLNLFSNYAGGLIGTEIKIDVYPNGVEDADAFVKIHSEDENFSYIEWFYADQTPVQDLQNIPNGTTVFARIKQNTPNISLLDGIQVKVSCVNFEEAENTITFKTYESVKEIKVNNLTDNSVSNVEDNRIMVEKGNYTDLDFTIKNQYDAEITFAQTDIDAQFMQSTNKAKIQKVIVNGVTTLRIIGYETCDLKLNIYSQNGTNVTYDVKVFIALDNEYAHLYIPSTQNSSSVALLDNTENSNIKLKMFVGTSLNVEFIINKDETNEYATVVKNFDTKETAYYKINNQGKIEAYNITQQPSDINLSLTGWNYDENGVCQKIVQTYSIKLSVVESLNSISLKVENGYSNKIYTKESLGALYIQEPEGKDYLNLSKTKLSVELQESLFKLLCNEDMQPTEDSITYKIFLNDNEIPAKFPEDILDIEDGITLTYPNNKISIEFSAKYLNDPVVWNSQDLVVRVEFTHYGRTISAQRVITVEIAQMVSSISVLNLKSYSDSSAGYVKYQTYFEERDGVGENAGNNTVALKTQVEPSSARNLKLRYFSSNSNIATVDEYNGEITPQGAGECYIYIISEDSVYGINDDGSIALDNTDLSNYNPTQKYNLPQANKITAVKVFVADGTEENPYEINTAQELVAVNNNDKTLSYHYVLNSHINLDALGSKYEFAPIGSYKPEDATDSLGFNGSIKGGRDGYSFTISNLNIKDEGDNIGFVSVLNENAKLENLTFVNLNIISQNAKNTGAFAGINNGFISGTYVKWNNITEESEKTQFLTSFNNADFNVQAIITASGNAENVGGVAGINNGTIQNMSVTAKITALNNVGGIVGTNNNVIYNSLANCKVEGEQNVGGAVGVNSAGATIGAYTIQTDNSTGEITETITMGVFVELYNDTDIIKGTSVVGGIVGNNQGNVYLSYVRNFTDNVLISATAENIDAGAFAGTNTGNISQTYAMLNQDLASAYANEGEITDCFINSHYQKDNEETLWVNNELKYNPVEKIPESLALTLKNADLENIFNILNKKTFVAYIKATDGLAGKDNNSYSLNDLLTITPTPTVSYLQLVASSSNSSVVSVIGNNLVLVRTGKATITLTALKNKNVLCSFDIYVENLITNISYSSAGFNTDKTILTVERMQTVKIQAIANSEGFDSNTNIKYVLIKKEAISFNGNNNHQYENIDINKIVITQTDDIEFSAEKLTIKAKQECELEVTLAPYIQLDNGIIFVLANQVKHFTIKCTERATSITANSNAETIAPIDTTDITVTMVSTKASGEDINHFITDLNGNKVEDDNLIFSIEKTSSSSTQIDSQLKITKTQNVYNIKVKEEYKDKIKENTSFLITFYSSVWYSSSDNKIAGPTATYKLTITPQELIRISVDHYPLGNGPYPTKTKDGAHQPEVPTNIIVPGKVGILQFDLYPTYAHVKEVYISSSNSNSDKITFEQVEYVKNKNDNFFTIQRVYPLPTYMPDGRVKLTLKEDQSTYYIRTYLGSGVSENTKFYIDITGVSGNSSLTTQYELVAINQAQAEVLTPTGDGFVMDVTVEKDGSPVIQSYIVAGVDTSIALKQERFDNVPVVTVNCPDNTDLNGLVSVTRQIDSKTGEFIKTINRDGSVVYHYDIKVDKSQYSSLFGKVFEIKFTMVATINGISETINITKYIMFVDKKVENFKLVSTGGDIENEIPYGGSKTYVLCADFTYFDGEEQVIAKTVKLFATESNEGENNKDREFLSKLIDKGITKIEENYIQVSKEKSVESDEHTSKIKISGIKLVASTILKLEFEYYYNNGYIDLYETGDYNSKKVTCTLDLYVDTTTNYDQPIPIYNQQEFEAMVNKSIDGELEDYILMQDITLENYKPLDLDVNSFDGNNHTITIKNFDLSDFYENGFEKPEIDIGLFKSVSQNSIIKNLKLDIGQLDFSALYKTDADNNIIEIAELSAFTTVKVGLFAVENNGIITNCNVQNLNNNEPEKHFEFKISNNNVATSYFSLFVVTNNGNITNSSVGRNGEDSINHSQNSLIKLSANGLLSAFISENYGVISSSFAKEFTLYNTSELTNTTLVSGFAGYNANKARISYSYSLGYSQNLENNSYTGNALISKGTGAGFVYENRGIVNDCYSNIALTAIKSQSAGFVYKNLESGNIKNCLTLSLITQNTTSNSLFCAVDDLKKPLNDGKLEYCYAYDQTGKLSTITDTDTGVVIIAQNDFKNTNSYSFQINDSYANWEIKDGPFLAVANQRITRQRTLAENENQTQDNVNNQYVYTESNEYGSSALNPFIIRNAQEFNTIIRTYLKDKNGDKSKIENRHFLFVNDIDFENTDIATKGLSFEGGSINGNGFALKNISLVQNDNQEYTDNFGLFNTITSSTIKNIQLNIEEVTATKTHKVGALAGTISRSNLLDINLTATNDKSVITGLNFVGGIAGRLDSSEAYNITNNAVSVNAEFAHGNVGEYWSSINEIIYSITNNIILENEYSYAGGLFGVIETSNNIGKLTVQGKLQVKAENAGGVVGYLDLDSTISDAKFVAIYDQISTDYSQLISGSRSAGGIVAHNAGTIKYACLDFEQTKQADADNKAATSPGVKNGISNLFSKANLRTGALVGFLTNGTIENSYSRVDVINSKANIAGGLVGEAMAGTIKYCYTTSSVFANNKLGANNEIHEYIGGVIGKVTGDVTLENVIAMNNWNSSPVLWNNGYSGFDEFANIYEGTLTTTNCYTVQKTIVTVNNKDSYKYNNETNIKGYTYKDIISRKIDAFEAFKNQTICENCENLKIWDTTATFPRFNLYKNGVN